MKIEIRSSALLSFLTICLAGTATSAAEPEALSGPWKHQDIGAIEVKGTAALKDGLFTISGTLDTWGTNDGFHFVWQPFHGDAQIVARVLSVENTLNHAKAGLMFRESLTADSKHAEAAVTAVDGTQFLVRAVTGEKTTSAKTGLSKGVFPYWVKLVRAGDKFSGYESTDGEKWTLIGETNVSMSATFYGGLVTSSHQKAKLCTSTIDHVKVTKTGL
jgi:regulation of enolase protein 1 (concanavalin A-like superfamily)